MNCFKRASVSSIIIGLSTVFACCFFDFAYCQKKFKTSEDRIKLAGYKPEVHKVTTVDGYVLTLFRILTPSNELNKDKRHFPVMIQHGLSANSDCFLFDNDGLGFALAEDKWDVWLSNIRGNSYSRNNTHMSPNGPKFWNYSWHDMGQKDITAVIDYILNVTGRDRLNYIGHSMGTTMFYVMASTMPSYNGKINTMISLAPIARMTKWHLVANNATYIYQYVNDQLMKGLRNKKVEFLPSSGMKGLSKHQYLMEDAHITLRSFLELVIKVLNDWTNNEGMFPDSTSVRNVYHYIQNIGSGRFQKFDYGTSEKNMKAWGAEKPPLYELNRIRAPIALYYATADEFASVQDSEYLARMLPNVLKKVEIGKKFTHFDFCITTAKENLKLRREMHSSIKSLLQSRDSADKNSTKKRCEKDQKIDCVKPL